MKDKSMSAGTILMPLTLAVTLLLAGCGDFWEAPSGNTGTTASTTTLTATQSGSTVTLTATVAAASGSGTPTGSVTFSDASGKLGSAVNLSSGVATYTTTSLAAGSYSFTATYSGDSTYATSTSSSVPLAVTAGGTTASSTALVSSSASPALGASVTFTATVTPSAATGTVTFYDGTTSLGTGTLSASTPDTATYTTTTLALGTHSITATYSGDSTYAGSTSSVVTVTVAGATSSTTTIQPLASTPIAGDSVTLIATVTPATGTGTPTGTVTFIDSTNPTSVTIGPATLNSGQAVLATEYFATAGTYTVSAAYSGDSTYAASTSAAMSVTVIAAIQGTACGLQDSTNSVDATAADAYLIGTNTLSGADATIQVSAADESAICAENAGTSLTVTSPAITSSSIGSNANDSNYSGTNAAVLAYGTSSNPTNGASITMTGGSIATSGQYGNAVFASGDGASISLNGVSITTSGADAHGADAAEGGTLDLNNVSITTAGQNSPAVATDQGGGTVTVNYGVFNAQNAEAVVVDGSGSINLTSTALNSALGNDRGILLYQNASGAGTSSFTMAGTGSSISYTCNAATMASCANGVPANGTSFPATLFAVADTTATISLTNVTVNNNTSTDADSSGTLLEAEALNGSTTSSNVTFTALGEDLTGDVIVDNYSTIALTLNEDSATTPVPSTLTGAINSTGSAGTVSLTLDSASSWTVTATSNLTTLSGLSINGSNVVSNINGGGHCVYYSGTVNGTSGTTYTLSGSNGGYLAPTGTTTGITCN